MRNSPSCIPKIFTWSFDHEHNDPLTRICASANDPRFKTINRALDTHIRRDCEN